MPSAMSSPSEPVDTVSTSIAALFLPSRMIEPLPKRVRSGRARHQELSICPWTILRRDEALHSLFGAPYGRDSTGSQRMRRTAPDVLPIARIEAMYTICSRFAICSFRALGSGPFPKPLVPFDSLGWPLLENTPNNNRRLLNVISMTATSTRLGGSGQPSVEPDALEAIGGLSVASPARPPQLAASVGAGKGVGIGKSRCCSIPKRSLIFCS